MMIFTKLKFAFFSLMVSIVFLNSTQAQNKKLEKADKAYNKFSFIDAAKLYEELVKDGDNTVGVYTKLGDCYYYNGNYAKAEQSYAKIVNSNSKIDPEYYFRYAQTLSNSKKYNDAAAVMKTYYLKTGKEDLSENWTEAKLLQDIKKQSGRYTIKSVEINTPFSDFGGAFYDTDKVIFASARDTGVVVKRKHSWNEKSFIKLYTAEITTDGGLQNPVRLKGDVNSKYHQSSPAITKDGKTMYFTRNNFADGKLGTDKEGTSNLKIYVATNVNGQWKNVKELPNPVNSNGFSSAHPALSPDETQLYFASDRNNKFGNSDLYVVSLKKGGIVNDLTKLGGEINTLGRETYPYLDASGILYFSSDGHPGFGGLDVFAAIKDENGKYHVVNLGDGVNSSDDDFAYAIDDATQSGYFSSNRAGNDDIYSFKQDKPVDFDFKIKPNVYGTLADNTAGKPIEGMAIEVYDANNDKVNTYYTDKDGKYSIDLDPYKEYTLIYKKPGFAEKTVVVEPLKPLEKKQHSYTFLKEMEVMINDLVVTLQEGDDLTYKMNLKPIYFNYSGFNIRKSSEPELDAVVQLLHDRPNISLKVNSHTDSRGKDDFNLKLSESRAKATVDYIVNHGIDKKRVTGQGFGETQLINNCSNGVSCTEAEHELNRRSEFIIILDK
jgi:outer membrane protein OmpA-like peptidoglycan-associated protein/tetratricopeptide (TPR) repeat protein